METLDSKIPDSFEGGEAAFSFKFTDKGLADSYKRSKVEGGGISGEQLIDIDVSESSEGYILHVRTYFKNLRTMEENVSRITEFIKGRRANYATALQ